MWRHQTSRGQKRYDKRGDRDYGRDNDYRTDDRQKRDSDRYDERYSERHREDHYSDNRDNRYSDVPREEHDQYREDRGYNDQDWGDRQPDYTDQNEAPYYDRVDERRDYRDDDHLHYRDDRAGDGYDRDSRDPDYDGTEYTRQPEDDRPYVRDDRDLYRDDRGYDDVEGRHHTDQYDYRNDEARLREDTVVHYDDDDNRRDCLTYKTQDGERIDYREDAYDRRSDRKVSDVDNFNERGTTQHIDSDKVGHNDRRHDSDDTRRGQGRSFRGKRNRVTSGLNNRQNVRHREVNSGQGRMKITVNRNSDGQNQKLDKRGPVNQRDNRKGDSKNDRQARNSSKDSERVGRGARLRDDRGRSSSGRSSGRTDRADNTNARQSVSTRHDDKTLGSVRSASKDNKHRQSGNQNSRTDKVSPKSNEKISNKGHDSKSKVDSRSKSKDAERERRISDNSRRSSRDQKGHRSTSRQILDSKNEAIKSFGSFHEDDAISILADDDRFANETNTYFDTENNESSKNKSEKTNVKGMSGRKDVSQNHSQSSRNKESRRVTNKGFTSTRYGSSRYYYNSRNSRNTLGRATGQSSVRSRDKNAIQTRSSSSFSNRFNKFKNESTPQLRNMSMYGKKFREEGSNITEDRDINREDSNESNEVSVQIGRTGAVLSEDRAQDDNEYHRKPCKKLDGNRQGISRNDKPVNSIGDPNSFSKIKTNYFKSRRKYLQKRHQKHRDEVLHSYGLKNMDGDLLDDENDNGEDRNEASFNEPGALGQMDMDVTQQNQQLIFIPNADMQDGQVPLIDQFGNPLINPSAVHPGGLQQIPVQFIPNVGGELPPGSEYMFIPFVNNDPATNLAETNINFVNPPNVGNDVVASVNKDQATLEKPIPEKPAKKRATAAVRLARKRLRTQLLKKRREDFEKKVERRVFFKLMQKAKLQVEAESKNKTKAKPVLKRISPPAGTSRQTKPSAAGKGEYDNVSDVEDITDDEDDMAKSKERRPAFRKPGEPRLGVRGKPTPTRTEGGNYERPAATRTQGNNYARPTATRIQGGNYERPTAIRTQGGNYERPAVTRNQGSNYARPAAIRTQGGNYNNYERSDTRKVIERVSPQSGHFSEKRTKDRREENYSFSKRLKVDNDFPPIKITVSNEKFSQYDEIDDNSQENEAYNEGYTSQQRSFNRESKDMSDGRRLLREVEERGEGRYDEDMSGGADRHDGQYRSDYTDRWEGKYRDNSHMSYPQKSRFSGPGNNHNARDNRRSRWSEPNQGNNNNQMGNNRNNPNANSMPAFNNNRMPQPVSAPFAQQPMSQTQSQMNSNSSLPVQYPNSGFQFNSDPSLPPVSQGTMNMSSFGQSNFNPQIDMSLPPVAGHVGGSPANMAGPQQNFQSQRPMQQSVFNSPQQGNTGSFFNQQGQNMNMQRMGGIAQSNMNQRKNFQNNMQGNQPNFQVNNSPQFQQGPFQMNSGPGTIQQQQQQPVIGGVLAVGSQSQNTFQTSQQNQHSMTGTSNSGQNTGQGYLASRGGTANNPSSQKEAMTGVFSVGNTNSTVTCTGRGYAVRPLMGGVIKVPGASMQGGGVAVMQSGSGLNVDNRGNTSGGRMGPIPDRGQKKAMEEDDDFGELLCSKCDKVFSSESMMRRHSKWHMLADAGVQELRCDNCLEGFTSSVAFSAHMSENHRLTSWMCDKCNIFFVSKLALTRHQSRKH